MLSRHFLRAKVLQEVYAYYCSEMPSIAAAERSLVHNVERLNDLGATQLAMTLQLIVEAERVTEEATQKFMATEADRNPDRRLLNNEVARRLTDNYDFKKQSEHTVGLWEGEQARFRKAYAGFKETKYYQEYMSSKPGFAADREVFVKLFKYLMNDEGLRSTVVERSLLWEDDYDQVAQYEYMFLKTLDERAFDEAMAWPRVYDERSASEHEAMEFALLLLRETLRNADESNEMIKSHLQGWEFDRVAQMDVYLVDMALAELQFCPSIPERVTVDEYIELSKEFSTDRSRLFINGLLDRLILELRSAGKIVKTGRGLLKPETEEEGDDER